VALENYTKFQKMMLLILVVVGAALFTVTGAMMAVAEGCGQKGQASRIAGTINGQDVTRELFNARKNALGFGWDIMVPVFPDEGLSKTLLINNIIEGEGPFHGRPAWNGNGGYRLFAMWPRKHDQNVWMFSALVERAKAAGFKLPALNAAEEYYFKQISGDQRMDRDARIRWFNDHGFDPNITLRAVAEVMMVRDYVNSLVSRHTVTNEDALVAYHARFPERKAKVYRIAADRFRAQAQAEIEAANAASAASSAAAALSGAGGFGAALEPMERLNRFPTPAEKEVLEREQQVAFDLIVAEYKELADAIPTPGTDELKSFYSNIRGQSFRVSPADATPERIEERFQQVLAREKEVLAGSEPSKEWQDQTKADLKQFYDYHERSSVVIEQLKLSNAQTLARVAIESINTDLEDKRKEIKDGLDASVKTMRERKSISTSRLGMVNSVDDQIKPLIDAPLDEVSRVLDLWRESTTANDQAAVNGLFSGIQSAFTSSSGIAAASKSASLRRFINLDQEKRAVRDREIEVGDIEDLQTRTPPEEDDFEGKEKAARARIQVEAAKARLAEAERLRPLVEALCDKVDAYVVEIELRAGAAQGSPNAAEALRQLCRDLAFDWPMKIREWSKGIIPEGLKAELEAAGALVDREAERASKQADRTSKDQSGLPFSSMVRGVKVGRGMTVNLRFDTGIDAASPMTMKELARSSGYFWIENVSEAKSFLSNTDYPAGSVSRPLHRPGIGYYLLRLKSNQEAIDMAARERPEVATSVLVGRRARELATIEANRLRQLADASGDARAFLDAEVAKGTLAAFETDWFAWQADVPGIRLVPDPDSDSATGLDDNRPMGNFFNAIKAIGPTTSVSTPFLEGTIDWANRAGGGEYQVSLAVLTGQRSGTTKRLPMDGSELEQIQVRGIALTPKLAADADLLTLIDPGKLMDGYKVVYDLVPYEQDQADDETPTDGSKPPKA
jgi:hypothetical protein